MAAATLQRSRMCDEDPGTVPASANGRGYALFGLMRRRIEARSIAQT